MYLQKRKLDKLSFGFAMTTERARVIKGCTLSSKMNQENVLDTFNSIHLPLQNPSNSGKAVLGSLTHPSKLAKRSGGKVSNSLGRNVKRKRKFDCPDIFDHLAMLRLKQQKCTDNGVSQEVPVSPILDTSCSDSLSLHPTPRKDLKEEKEEVMAGSLVSFKPVDEAQLGLGNQCLEGENWINRDDGCLMKEHGQPLLFSSSSTCASWDTGNSQEFKTSHAVPCFPMEHGRPSKVQQQQLARVPSSLSPERVVFEDWSTSSSPSQCVAGGFPLAVSLSSLAGRQEYGAAGRDGLGPVDGRSFCIRNFYPREE